MRLLLVLLVIASIGGCSGRQLVRQTQHPLSPAPLETNSVSTPPSTVGMRSRCPSN